MNTANQVFSISLLRDEILYHRIDWTMKKAVELGRVDILERNKVSWVPWITKKTMPPSLVDMLNLDRVSWVLYRDLFKLAVENGHLEVIKWLIQHDASIGCIHDVMDIAHNSGHLDIVKWLCSQPSGCTVTPMQWATENHHTEIVDWLKLSVRGTESLE